MVKTSQINVQQCFFKVLVICEENKLRFSKHEFVKEKNGKKRKIGQKRDFFTKTRFLFFFTNIRRKKLKSEFVKKK